MIYHKGESINTLNFVMTGSLEVIHDDQVIAILSKCKLNPLAKQNLQFFVSGYKSRGFKCCTVKLILKAY